MPLNYRMRIYKTLFFSVLLVLTACSNNSVPSVVLPPETMVPVLVDLHIVDGGLYNISQAPDSMYKYGMGNYIQVFKKHHTDSLTFRKSFKYYTTNPKLMTEIYDNVVKILQAKSDSVDKVIVKPKAALPAPPTHAIPANVKPKAALPAPPTHAVPTK